MIRIATLYQAEQHDLPVSSLEQTSSAAPSPQEPPLDILCCQIRQQHNQGLKESQDYLRQLAASVQMSCSSTVPVPAQENGQRGTVLSMCTASSVWMLNSGSLSLPHSFKMQQRVQFALVRKASTAVLIINAHYDARRQERLALVRALFSHQIFKEQQYAAVLLCAERGLRLSRREAGQLMLGTGFTLHSSHKNEGGGTGAIMLCVPQERSLAPAVELGQQGAWRFGVNSAEMAQADTGKMTANAAAANAVASNGLMLEFQVQPVPHKSRKKPRLPLSFAEQWAGYKEHLRPSAAV